MLATAACARAEHRRARRILALLLPGFRAFTADDVFRGLDTTHDERR